MAKQLSHSAQSLQQTPQRDTRAPHDLEHPRHGVREVRPSLLVEQLMARVGHGQRLEILRVLSHAALSVSSIVESLFSKMNSVSHDLAILKTLGLVTSSQTKNNRIYRLTDRVRVLRKGERTQLIILNEVGQWILVNIDETGDPNQFGPPPDQFVEVEARPGTVPSM